MPCRWIGNAIVCSGRARRPRLCQAHGCNQPSRFQCDAPMLGDATCDADLCAAHATRVGPDRHLCPVHAAVIEPELQARLF